MRTRRLVELLRSADAAPARRELLAGVLDVDSDELAALDGAVPGVTTARLAPDTAGPLLRTTNGQLIHVAQGRGVYRAYDVADGTAVCVTKENAGIGEWFVVPAGGVFSFANRRDGGELGLVLVALHGTASVPWTGPVRDDVPDPDDYYYGYDERYSTVYEHGGTTWESTEPNDFVLALLPRLDDGVHSVIDLGCGEGRDAIFLAGKGYDVLGVDVSHAALRKARERAAATGVSPVFVERDVIALRGIPDNAFDLALNMGCLHMLTESEQRRASLRRTYEVLRPGGLFLVAHCAGEWLKGFFSVPHYDEVGPVVPGRVIQRRIRLARDDTTMIPLPLLPFHESSAEDLAAELRSIGFEVLDTSGEFGEAFGTTAVLLARRPRHQDGDTR